jgi:hypothetical protein
MGADIVMILDYVVRGLTKSSRSVALSGPSPPPKARR